MRRAAPARAPVVVVGAGARMRDLEFVQFHPTALDIDRHCLPLLTEALRGAGATPAPA